MSIYVERENTQKKVSLINPIAYIYSKNKTNALGSFMELTANILGSSIVQSVVNVGFPVFTSFYFANNKGINCLFKIVTGVYILLILLFIYLDNRKTRKKEEAESLAEVSTQLQKLVYNRMQTLDRECVKYVTKESSDFDTNIESEADFICDALFSVLSHKFKYDDIEVVLWQQMPDESGNGSIAYPVSFGTKGDRPPTWMNDQFHSTAERPYRIIECFLQNRELKFLTREKCQKELVFQTEEAKKESKTVQYIALPIRKRDGFTSAVIQFRTFKKKVFPVNESDVDHIIDNWIAPFTNFYELSLEEQNVIEEILEDA